MPVTAESNDQRLTGFDAEQFAKLASAYKMAISVRPDLSQQKIADRILACAATGQLDVAQLVLAGIGDD